VGVLVNGINSQSLESCGRAGQPVAAFISLVSSLSFPIIALFTEFDRDIVHLCMMERALQ